MAKNLLFNNVQIEIKWYFGVTRMWNIKFQDHAIQI